MYKILIAEDDSVIALIEKDYLEMNDYEVTVTSDGISALSEIEKNIYDLVILDIMLPNKSGYDICRQVRSKITIPILMVTAKTEAVDKIRGLGLGADDYIIKPFEPLELVARVKAHLAQYKRLMAVEKSGVNDDCNINKSNENTIIEIDNIKIFLQNWKVFKDQIEIKLPNQEFKLLVFLASNPNIVFSKERLFEKIWGLDYIGDMATVTVHINRIREKIEKDSKNPKIIETVWGAGYRLNLHS
jgi:DNA-binding response OmpR family regulator